MPSEEHSKRAKKAMSLKWKKGISLKEAWAEVSKKKRKSTKSRGEPVTRKSKTRTTRPTTRKSTTRKSTTRTTRTTRPKTKTGDKKKRKTITMNINGKDRKVTVTERGAKYYKSKGEKKYVK